MLPGLAANPSVTGRLDDSAPKVRMHNGQLRSMLSQKDEAYREKGLEEKITKLIDFTVV